MAYELTGTIKKIFPRQDFPSGFYKQEVVVSTVEERFPQDIKLDCLKEKADLLQNFKEGDSVKVFFDLRGREWNERYFVDLSVWKLEAVEGKAAAPAGPPVHEPEPEPAEAVAEEPGNHSIEEDEDIPF